jgi:hypothetical protein
MGRDILKITTDLDPAGQTHFISIKISIKKS